MSVRASVAAEGGSGYALDGRPPSAQSRWLARGMRVAFRPGAEIVSRSPRATRVCVDAVMRAFSPPPQGTLAVTVRDRFDGLTVAGEWVHPRGVESAAEAGGALLYMHGSGFVACSPRTHRGLAARVARAAGLPAFVPDYRLAPEHPFPAAADDTLAAYRWLVEAVGLRPERMVVAGDSAGGHLAISLAAELCRRGDPVPAALVLFSPFIDPTYELSAARDRLRRDPAFPAALVRRLVGTYLRTAELDDPRVALLRCDPEGLPPMLLQAGELEMLSAEAEAFAELVNSRGGRCELQMWPGQIHVFQALYRYVPEAREALRDVGRFVRATLDGAA